MTMVRKLVRAMIELKNNATASSSSPDFSLCRGVKPVDKREGGGSHNWGTYEDEIKAEDDKVCLFSLKSLQPKQL